MKIAKTVLGMSMLLSSGAASGTAVVGKVVTIEGHIFPACRLILIRRDDNGGEEYYRIPDTGADNSIMSVGLTAIATGMRVEISYTAGLTTGCGTEPRVEHLRLLSGR